ncbi:adenosine receptor A3-like [Montipora foliosa]|uniref:adenosine receptor A3-like n=1 Tax=Montipora foliosa TaxID=591990 RepID=UPI0035F1F9E0
MEDHTNLQAIFIANFILNIFFALAAIVLNSVTIHAIRRTYALTKPQRTLLLSLSISDLSVGLAATPAFAMLLAIVLEARLSGNAVASYALKISSFIADLSLYASMLGVLALSVDGFLAVHVHLRYGEIVTHKRVLAGVIIIWVVSTVLSVSNLWISIAIRPQLHFNTAFILPCVVTTAILHYKIHSIVLRHRNAINGQLDIAQDQQETLANMERQKLSVKGTFYIYLACLVLYLPRACICAALIKYHKNTVLLILYVFSLTFWFLSSCLNPLIYCWKLRHIRHAVVEILRKTFLKATTDTEEGAP